MPSIGQRNSVLRGCTGKEARSAWSQPFRCMSEDQGKAPLLPLLVASAISSLSEGMVTGPAGTGDAKIRSVERAAVLKCSDRALGAALGERVPIYRWENCSSRRHQPCRYRRA